MSDLTISQLCEYVRHLTHRDLLDGVHVQIADAIQATPRVEAPDLNHVSTRALQVKERWHNQLVEWLRIFHPEVYADYQKRVMAINKIENAPNAIGPPPGIIMHGPPGEGLTIGLQMKSARPEAIDESLVGEEPDESD